MLYLSWLPSYNTPFDPVAHAKEDEFCIRGSIFEQEEGDIINSGFEVEIPNPGIGLIGLGRSERYAVLSEKLASDNIPVELARGRVIAVPSELGQQTLTLRFQCVPPDEDVVLKAAANALRTGEIDGYDPYGHPDDREKFETYDALFHSRDASDDPMSALAGRLEFWRWDRKTLQIGRVNMVTGGSTHVIDSDGFETTLQVTLRNPPRAKTRLRVVASWTQEAKGVQSLPAVNLPVDTYSWQDLMQNLPQPGTAVGENTGWHVAESEITYFNQHSILDSFDAGLEKYALNDEKVIGCQILMQAATVGVQIRLGYDFQQQREELLTISMPVAQQEILGDDKNETADIINLAPLNLDPSTPLWTAEDPTTLEPMQYNVGDEVIYNGHKWRCITAHTASSLFSYSSFVQVEKRAAINPISARFFDSTRGTRAVRYAIRMLQRRVYVRARCLEISFQCEWSAARSMKCGDFCRIYNRKIGSVQAKISSLKLVAAGAKRYAEITLLAYLGDGSLAPTPELGEEQTGLITYRFSSTPASQPTNASALRAQVHFVDVVNDYAFQKSSALYEQDPVAIIEGLPTRIELDVDPIREEDLLTRNLTVTCKPIWLPREAVIGS
ncbi:carbohydrate-binding protein [Ochrobactrum soli]|uniref:Chitin-binding type-3 domain-containing protein n=1 Tax=Ochrobactrum soli TaxID=2448455 RepID=A0A2P9HLU1_9HYPH|nr:carbohydrate-binding protein [[Ochrobactrum] soli]SPL65061.1 hypothetical protein OHAE_928 [[Ochrobactrum] soli]